MKPNNGLPWQYTMLVNLRFKYFILFAPPDTAAEHIHLFGTQIANGLYLMRWMKLYLSKAHG